MLVSLILGMGLTACRPQPKEMAAEQSQSLYSVRVIGLENGYGYEVLKEGKVLIRQTEAPALAGVVLIEDSARARELGNRVCDKLDQGQWPPSLSAEEVRAILTR